MITFLWVNLISIIVLFLINKFIIFVPYNLSFIFWYLMILIIVNIITGFFIAYKWEAIEHRAKSRVEIINRVLIGLISLLIILPIINFIISGKTINHKEYRSLAGEIEEIEFSDKMEVVDISKLPINNSSHARNLADKKLGEIPSLGSQVEIGSFTFQKVNGELYYVAPLNHTSFFKWMNNKEGTPGYIMVNASKANDVKLVTELDGKEIKLKYLESACFGSDLKRYAFNKNSKVGLTDYSFELNDEGRPYWVVSMYDKVVGFKGKKVNGTLIIDAQTGESTEYSLEETPQWVDRIQPKDIVEKNLENWGELVHGAWNFSDKDKITLTDGIKVIYNGDECYYYTGITSVGSDESLIGFFLTNTRSGTTSMYKMAGAIESAAMSSAEGKLQQFKYEATWPTLINVQGEPTYFMPMLDSKGLTKNYAFVNVKNYNIVGTGETLNNTLDNYIEVLSRDPSSDLVNNSEVIELEGTIERIGMYLNNNSSYYMITIVGNNKKFIIPTEVANIVAIAEKGDNIKITYIENTSDIITVKSFENKTR